MPLRVGPIARRDRARLLRLIYFLARRNLPGPQKRLHQRTLSADNQLRKSFEPLTFRDLRIGIQPSRKQSKLRRRNLPVSNSPDQMRHERVRDPFALNPGHCSAAVKARKNLCFEPICLCRIFRGNHLIGQGDQFIW